MTPALDQTLVKQWLDQKTDLETITDDLTTKGFDAETVSAYLAAYKKMKRDRKQVVGFIVTTAGAVLGFISCVLSIVNPIPSLYNLFLFGVTSLAILLIVAGMYLVFE